LQELIVQEKPIDNDTENGAKGLNIVIDKSSTIQSEPLVNVDISTRDAWMMPVMPFVKDK
jgi:hypothetical protein